VLDESGARLAPAMRRMLDARRASLETRARQLDALSPLAILSRGYSVTLAGGRALLDADAVSVNDELTVRLHRGELRARVVGKKSSGT
jgi:exodeoxyribonuclease VII large subunit